MGYYTKFTLTVLPDTFSSSVLDAILNKLGYNPFEDSVKWYEYKEDIADISKKFPVLIIIDGEGDEAGDIWRKIWFKGNIVMDWECDTTPPEPSEKLLAKIKKLNIYV